MGASASFDTSVVPVEPGGQVEVRLRVRNTGPVVDQFTFEPVGIAPAWVRVEPAQVRLFPETEEYVTVTMSPPRSADTPLGDLTFALRVISAEDPDGSVAEELTLQISPYAQRGGELTPKTSTGRTKGVHQLALDNHGNAAISPSVVCSDDDNLLTFEVEPPSIDVQPGTAEFVKITVKPRARFWRGQPKSLPFTVTIYENGPPPADIEVPDGAPETTEATGAPAPPPPPPAPGAAGDDDGPVVLDGMFVQQPMVPKWLWKVLLALLLLALLLWILWKTLLEPKVESTARDSVAELVDEEVAAQVEEAVEPINERLDEAGIPPAGGGDDGGGGGGGGGGDTTTTVAGGGGDTTTSTTSPPPDTTITPPTTTPGDTTTTTPSTTAPPLDQGGPVDFRLSLVDGPLGDAAVATQAVAPGQRLELTDIIFQNPTGALGELRIQRNNDILFQLQLANFRDIDYHFVAPYVFDESQVVQAVLICIDPGQLLPADPSNCSAAVSFSGFLVPADS
jgi:hypothetical protein